MYDLVNIFEIFLPQLLLYPNPSDPLNAEAASLQIKSPDQYNQKVKQYVFKFAKSTQIDVEMEKQDNETIDCKVHLMGGLDTWQSNGIDWLSDTSDIDMIAVSSDEELET